MAAGLALAISSAITYVLFPGALTIGTARSLHGSELDASSPFRLGEHVTDDPLWAAVRELSDPTTTLELLRRDGVDDLATLKLYSAEMLMAAGLRRGHAVRVIATLDGCYGN